MQFLVPSSDHAKTSGQDVASSASRNSAQAHGFPQALHERSSQLRPAIGDLCPCTVEGPACTMFGCIRLKLCVASIPFYLVTATSLPPNENVDCDSKCGASHGIKTNCRPCLALGMDQRFWERQNGKCLHGKHDDMWERIQLSRGGHVCYHSTCR